MTESSSDQDNPRAKTTLRFRYEAEAQLIKERLGDLEAIRETLGLSQRKMCQLLLVDPSSWSRWVHHGSAPPHVYRALEWYLNLKEKNPQLDHQLYLSQINRRIDQIEEKPNQFTLPDEFWELQIQLKSLLEGFEESIDRRRLIIALCIVNAVAACLAIAFHFIF